MGIAILTSTLIQHKTIMLMRLTTHGEGLAKVFLGAHFFPSLVIIMVIINCIIIHPGYVPACANTAY